MRLGFKAAWKDGTHAVLLDPLDFVARLAALVPPPRFHMLRYHGVLAAHAAARAEVVLGCEPPSSAPQLLLFEPSDAPLEPPPPSRHPWSWLLRRVFAVEVSVCPVEGCYGRMRVVEIAITPDDVACVLEEQPPRARHRLLTKSPPHSSSSRSPELDRDAFAPLQPPQSRGGWGHAPSHGPGASPERAPPRRTSPLRRVPDSDLGLKLALGGLVALIVVLVVVIVAGLASTVDDVPAEESTEASE